MKRFWTTLALFAAYQSWACCGVGPNGMPIRFGRQQDIVIFDSESKTEYFVRSASFESTAKAKAFGFIAPSPTMPELSTVEWSAFGTLMSLKPHGIGCSAPSEMAAAASSKSAGVEVLQDVQVGDFRAQTLKSSDASALEKYLKENRFVASQDILDWVKFYTDKKWLLTAFRVNQISSEAEVEQFGFDPIMMKFKTDQPFFPYFVPESNRSKESELDLYIVGSAPATNSVTRDANYVRSWDSSIPKETLAQLESTLKVPAGSFSKLDHVSAFEQLPFAVAAKDDGYIYFEPRWLSAAKSVFSAVLGIGVIWVLSRLVLRRRKQSF